MSFVVSLVNPVALFINVAIVWSDFLIRPLGWNFVAVSTAGLATTIAAIVTGHIALRRAKRYPPAQRMRGFAIAGLAITYVTLVLPTLAVAAIFLVFSSACRLQ